MPSVSGKQHRFFEMIAHNPQRAKQLGIKQSVGKDFVEADKKQPGNQMYLAKALRGE